MSVLLRFSFALCLVQLCFAINSYETPPCFGKLKECRENLGRKTTETLKGKYLLMIGDSLTRYQYLSLVYTLRHQNPPHVHMNPNMNENTHGEWIQFFKTSNRVLAPYEDCDCSYYGGRFFEHRRYYDPVNNIRVTYLMYRGFFIEGTNDTNSLWAKEPQKESAPQWSMGMKDYLLQNFTPKKVDFLVTNVGFFPFHESIVPAQYIQWMRHLSDRVVWKTTTAVMGETPTQGFADRARCNAYDAEMCATKHVYCMDTSWTQKVDQKLDYWNSNHFNEPVYSILNDQLMDILKVIPANPVHHHANGSVIRRF